MQMSDLKIFIHNRGLNLSTARAQRFGPCSPGLNSENRHKRTRYQRHDQVVDRIRPGHGLLATEVAKVDLKGKTRIDLVVGCDDEDEEAVEVPTITVEL